MAEFAAEFTMPSLGADMEAGTILEWLVKPGDVVRRGDIVAVVDTAKAAVDVECFTSGTVQRILIEPGQLVPVGTPLATIVPENGAETATPPSTGPSTGPPIAPSIAPSIPPSTPDGVHPPAGHHIDSPLVRRLATRLGVDLEAVRGSGPGGRVTRRDVELSVPVRRRISPYARRLAAELGVDLAAVPARDGDGVVHAAEVRAAAPVAGPVRPAQRPTGSAEERQAAMRAAIAALMARSKREIPHYYLSTTVDMAAALAWLRERNRELSVARRLVPAALLLKASAVAARRVPQLNGFWTDGGFVPAPAVHLGVAVSLRGGGLVAPAIHDAADLPLDDLMAALKDLVSRARSGRLRGSEMSDPTITVTNLGEQGVESVLGVIYPPQVALVGFGKIVDRPHAVDGLLGVRPLVTVTLSADHRASDGYTGARLLEAIDHLLQQPEEL